jgi:hypothetical protein
LRLLPNPTHSWEKQLQELRPAAELTWMGGFPIGHTVSVIGTQESLASDAADACATFSAVHDASGGIFQIMRMQLHPLTF